MSLCIIPCLCRYSRPNKSCLVYVLITCSTYWHIRPNSKHQRKSLLRQAGVSPFQGMIRISPTMMIQIHQVRIPTEYLKYLPPLLFLNISDRERQQSDDQKLDNATISFYFKPKACIFQNKIKRHLQLYLDARDSSATSLPPQAP